MADAATNQGLIARALSALGLNANAIAGALGNFKVESGFNPGAYNAREGAIGIAQWEGGRRTALGAYAARTGGQEGSLSTQLGFLGQELLAAPQLIGELNAAGSPGAAAAIFDAKFERSSGESRAARIAAAQQVAGGAVPIGAGGGAVISNASWLPGWLTGGGDGILPPGAAINSPGGKVLGALGNAAGSVGGDIASFAATAGLKLLLAGAGVALIVGGIIHTAAPVAAKATPLGAAAAAL